MNDNIDDPNNNDAPLVQDELETLKKRATQMGLTYHPKIGLEKLKAKIQLANQPPEVKDESIPESVSDNVSINTIQEESFSNSNVTVADKVITSPIAVPAIETFNQRRQRLKNESFRLIRIRVTCMNPNKREHEGEIFTVGNSLIGSIKKYIPFNVDAGYHVPFIIFTHMKERECQVFVTYKTPDGFKAKRGKLIKEFAIEVLKPLTREEIDALAIQQARSRSVEAL